MRILKILLILVLGMMFVTTVAQDAITIEGKFDSGLYIPNALAPTNPAEGVRYWQPKGYNIDEMYVTVYDCFGNILWYSDSISDGNFIGKWDGKINDKILPSGVYVYYIQYNFIEPIKYNGMVPMPNELHSLYGNIFLIR